MEGGEVDFPVQETCELGPQAASSALREEDLFLQGPLPHVHPACLVQ